MERITVRANPKCKYCLGMGISMHFKGGDLVCGCVTEQLRIITVAKKDYGIPGADRYTPGNAEFVVDPDLGSLKGYEGTGMVTEKE